jgi:23S rRNA (cytosine1962-C5)-methyltransferase
MIALGFLPLMTHVIVTKRGADRVRHGHLWIYRSDVVDSAGATGGSVVSVHDPRGNFVGQAFFSDTSEIPAVFDQTQ